MKDNPYNAPTAVVADRDRPAGSPLKGVIYGLLVDLGGTLAAASALMIGYGIYLATGGASPEEIERAAKELDPFSSIGLAAGAIGLGFSVLGGYVCARVAGSPELKWAAVVGAISAISGFVLSTEAYSLGTNIVLSALGFAMVMLGGHLGARRNARNP